jgi:hypothetical protein
MTEQRTSTPEGAAMRVRYALFGFAVGGIWLSSSGHSPWEHGLGILVLMAVVAPTLGWLAREVARRRGKAGKNAISPGRLVVFKGTLALIAVVVTIVADDRIPHLDVYLAVWLALMLTFGGPVLHHRLLTSTPRTKTPHTETRGAG